ncbi:MAG: hypothetical protein MJY43_05830, partial [Bacteroidales bacterium]|nr:hypothetical protein [Bacteroidales bacterium]
MNDKVKNSIAGKLAVRVSLDLAAAFILLLGGVFFALNREVKIEAEHYAKALIGIYSDLNVYESHNLQRPIDISFEDRAGFFGDYICSWYRVDYLYSFIPDLENNTVAFLSVNGNRKRLPGAGSFDSLQGRTV